MIKDTDEVFFVSGFNVIEFEDHTLQLNEGEMYVVPRYYTNLKPQTNAMFCWGPRGVVNWAKVAVI